MNKEKALLSLTGLSLGDAFGEQFFLNHSRERIPNREIPSGMWTWTDDTHMAVSVVEILFQYGSINQDALAKRFTHRLMRDGRMGYGRGTKALLERVYMGEDWRRTNTSIFSSGSFGNGAAMRVSPLGAYFCGDLERTVFEAKLSAEVTHAHIEGIAGAIAIAAAASLAASNYQIRGTDFIQTVFEHIPSSDTKEGVLKALDISPETDIFTVVDQLGNGEKISAQDTVPFCLWCAAHNLDNYAEALWKTVSGLGDMDTTCAIVGGIVALSAKEETMPAAWKKHLEPLPTDMLV